MPFSSRRASAKRVYRWTPTHSNSSAASLFIPKMPLFSIKTPRSTSSTHRATPTSVLKWNACFARSTQCSSSSTRRKVRCRRLDSCSRNLSSSDCARSWSSTRSTSRRQIPSAPKSRCSNSSLSSVPQTSRLNSRSSMRSANRVSPNASSMTNQPTFSHCSTSFLNTSNPLQKVTRQQSRFAHSRSISDTTTFSAASPLPASTTVRSRWATPCS